MSTGLWVHYSISPIEGTETYNGSIYRRSKHLVVEVLAR